MNGMIQETGRALGEGDIPAGGRTYLSWIGNTIGRYNGWFPMPKIYGVRFLFANLLTTPISGAKMALAWNPSDPTTGVNANPNLGYAPLTINGDASLPVPGSTADALGTAWTDWLYFPGGKAFDNQNPDYGYYEASQAMEWRCWLPPRTPATDYAMTWGTWGANAWDRSGTLTGTSMHHTLLHNRQGNLQLEYFYVDGDAVTSPTSVTVEQLYANKSPDNISAFGPPGPSSFPFLSAQFLFEAPQ